MFTDRLARDLESILVFDGRRAIVEPLIDAGRGFVLLLVLAVRLPTGGTGRGRLGGDATGTEFLAEGPSRSSRSFPPSSLKYDSCSNGSAVESSSSEDAVSSTVDEEEAGI